MEIDWWTLALQSINAIVLIWLLSHFLFSPVANLIAKRQQLANELLDDAQAVRSVANEDRQQAEHVLTQLASERSAALKSVSEDAEIHRKELLAKATKDAEQLIDQSSQELTLRQQQLNIDIRDNATHLALDIADKLMARLPPVSRVAGFIDGLIDGVKQLNESDRASLQQNKGPLLLRVADSLTEQQSTICLQAIQQELGQEVKINVSTDPKLLAGLELIGTHCAVRNSFRTDLVYIATALKSEAAAQ